MYGTTHAHLVHMCVPLLWGLEILLQSPPPKGGDRHLAAVSPPLGGTFALYGEISGGGGKVPRDFLSGGVVLGGRKA